METLRLLFSVAFIMALICNGQRTQLTQNVLVEDLLRLMEIHLDHCGVYDFCYVRATSHFNSSYHMDEYGSYGSCCVRCSCKPSCELSGLCCPDYWLKDILGEKTEHKLSNIDDLRRTIVADNVSQVSLPAVGNEKAEFEECVAEMQIKDNVRYKPGKINPGVWMTTTCPPAGNQSGSALTKYQCESVEPTNKENLIPVVSNRTGKMYRNKHCLVCREHHESYTEFNVYIVNLVSNTIDQWKLGYPEEILLRAARVHLGDSSYSVIYKPPKEFASVRECQVADIDGFSCRVTNNTERGLCELFYLPVFIKDGPQNTYNISRNAACLKCSTVAALHSCVLLQAVGGEYKLQLNLRNASFADDQIQAFQKIPNENHIFGNCKTGHVFDNTIAWGICRPLLCPARTFWFQGQCVPQIANMENVVMETVLKIQPQGRIAGKNIIEYRKRLHYLLDTSASEVFENNYVYGEWEKIMNDTLGFHVLYFVFGVNDTYVSYGHMIARLSAFIKVLSETSVKLSDMTTEVQVKVTVGSRGIYSLSRDYSRLYDADSNNEYTPTKPFIIPASFRNKHRMHLLPKHLCHRVAVTSREIVVQRKYFGTLVRTNKRVDFEWNKKRAQQYLVCVNDFIDGAHLNGRNALDVTGDHWLDSIRFEYIVGGITAWTVLLLLGLIANKIYRGRRIAGNT